MHCPFCNHDDTQVMETRILDSGDSIRRRRRCVQCDRRVTTYERIELSMPGVIKSGGSRTDFDRAKLEFSMKLALRKRPVAPEAFESALDHVEAHLFKLGLKEVPSATIGEFVMDELRKLDKVGYIRFASVYRSFQDVADFRDAIKEVEAPARRGKRPKQASEP